MEKDNETKNAVVETYAEDIARVIENDKEGLVKKIIQEQEKKEMEKKEISPEPRKNKLYILVSGVLICLALVLAFFMSNRSVDIVEVEKQFTPLVFNDRSSFIEIGDLNKEKIISSILTEVKGAKIKSGGLGGIYLTKNKQIVGLRYFLAALKSHLVLPSPIIVSDNFLIGLVNAGEVSPADQIEDPDKIRLGGLVPDRQGGDFFILIKIRTLTDVFDMMKEWEGKMFNDLHAFFEIPINIQTNYLLVKDFEDGTMSNKNARILYDQNGEIVMMYVFADENSLIITNKVNVVREIIVRLSSGQIRK